MSQYNFLTCTMIKSIEYDSDSEWPTTSLGRQLESLEETLLCPICQSLFNNPQMLNCGHTYCSLCIRRHFDRNLNRTTSDVCPSCRDKAETADLRTNRSIAAAVVLFSGLRKSLLSLASSEPGKDDEVVDVTSAKSKPQRNQQGSVVIERIAQFNFHGMTKDKMKKTIEGVLKNTKHKLQYDVDKDVLERRFREVVHLNNAQIGLDHPMSLNEIVKLVNEKEAAKELEAKKSLKTAAKLEKLKNGEVVKDLEDGFSKLAKRALEMKQVKASSAASEVAAAVPDSSVLLTQESADAEWTMDAIPVFDPAALSRAFERVQDPSSWGQWRVVMNSNDGRPFYFHTGARVGQFEVPEELLLSRNEFTASRTAAGDKAVPVVVATSSVAPDVTSVPYSNRETFTQGDHLDVDHLFPESQIVEGPQASQNLPTVLDAVDAANDYVTPTPAPVAVLSVGNLSNGEWSCSVCTFLNSVKEDRCEMCGIAAVPTARPKRGLSSTQPKISNSNGSSVEGVSQSTSNKRKKMLV